MIVIIAIILFLLYVVIKIVLASSDNKINPQLIKNLSCVRSSNFIGHNYQGVCPKIKSDSNLVWGPTLWNSLHLMAENYPITPSNNKKRGCSYFIKNLPYMLPCGECGYNLLQFLKNKDVANICNSRQNLRKYFVDSHNNINRHLDKSVWSVEEAEEYYQKIPSCLDRNKKWSSDKTI